ncbi:MAG: biopolymer transporter ExbD [Isosphaeraceae bacterium]|nr:biopolymer transporter ExbD [Isosphaeraceae bacterium]
MTYRDRARGERTLSPNLTPLLDVILQLIVFFMMLIHFGAQLEGGSISVRLPRTPSALPGTDLPLERLVISVDVEGRLIFEDSILDGESAKVWWAEQGRVRRKGRAILGIDEIEGPVDELPTLVVVRADRDAGYGAVRAVLANAQEEGFAHFSLITTRSREP